MTAPPPVCPACRHTPAPAPDTPPGVRVLTGTWDRTVIVGEKTAKEET